MQVPKASDAAKARFTSVVPDDARVVVKPMFGNLGAFVNGNMFAGLFGDSIGVRLPDESVRAELLAVEGAGPYGPAERPMGGYVSLPEEGKDDPDRLREWIGVALEQVGRMPPKEKKPRTAAPK